MELLRIDDPASTIGAFTAARDRSICWPFVVDRHFVPGLDIRQSLDFNSAFSDRIAILVNQVKLGVWCAAMIDESKWLPWFERPVVSQIDAVVRLVIFILNPITGHFSDGLF